MYGVNRFPFQPLNYFFSPATSIYPRQRLWVNLSRTAHAVPGLRVTWPIRIWTYLVLLQQTRRIKNRCPILLCVCGYTRDRGEIRIRVDCDISIFQIIVDIDSNNTDIYLDILNYIWFLSIGTLLLNSFSF